MECQCSTGNNGGSTNNGNSGTSMECQCTVSDRGSSFTGCSDNNDNCNGNGSSTSSGNGCSDNDASCSTNGNNGGSSNPQSWYYSK